MLLLKGASEASGKVPLPRLRHGGSDKGESPSPRGQGAFLLEHHIPARGTAQKPRPRNGLRLALLHRSQLIAPTERRGYTTKAPTPCGGEGLRCKQGLTVRPRSP